MPHWGKETVANLEPFFVQCIMTLEDTEIAD